MSQGRPGRNPGIDPEPALNVFLFCAFGKPTTNLFTREQTQIRDPIQTYTLRQLYVTYNNITGFLLIPVSQGRNPGMGVEPASNVCLLMLVANQ